MSACLSTIKCRLVNSITQNLKFFDNLNTEAWCQLSTLEHNENSLTIQTLSPLCSTSEDNFESFQ